MNYTADDIKDATRDDLRTIAKKMGVKGYYRTPKDELQAQLLALLENINEPVQEKAAPLVFFEKVSQMKDVQEVEQACIALKEELKLDAVQPKTRSNYLAPYSKLFKSLQPTPETAHLFFGFKAEGKSEYIQRHLFFKFTGLADTSWKEVNEDIQQRKQERQAISTQDDLASALEAPNKVFNLDLYLKTVVQLINSNDPYELGVGLIAASGRRPSEIVMLSDFELSDWMPSYIKSRDYGVKVNGLAKKREKQVTTYTSLLVPANDFVSRVEYFRSLPEIKAYQAKFEKLLSIGHDKETAWKKVEEQVGYQLREITGLYFDFLPKIDEGQNRKNILLRACATKILTLRDYPNATPKAKITYAGVLAGHVIPVFKNDGKVSHDGSTSASTLNYDDYEPDTTDIPFLTNVLTVKTPDPATETVPETKDIEDMARIAELESIVARLTEQLAQKDAEIIELKERMNRPKLPPMEVSEMDAERLFHTRKAGSADEKLNRVWQAITAYNDNTPEYKINPTSKVLRELSGVNGNTVKQWIEKHNDEVVSHQAKYALNEDGKGYYNNRYRGKTDMNVEMILETIEKEYLK